MENTLVGIAAILLGSVLIVFHKGFARLCADDQYRLWRLRYSKTLIKFSEIMGIVVGAGFLVFGILALLGLLTFR